MSGSSDDRRGRPPGAPTQRTPPRYGTPPQRDVAPPPPPRGRAIDWDDLNDDPYGDPRTGAATGPGTFDFEPSPLRNAVPSVQPNAARTAGSRRDIEPPAGPGLQDAYREVMTGPAAAVEQRRADQYAETREAPRPAMARPAPPLETDLVAETRNEKRERTRGQTAIVQSERVTGRSLMLVVVIMSFFACLTAGAVYLINQSAAAWLRDIAAEVTVQIEARDKAGIDRLVGQVTQYLEKQPGIRATKPLSAEENTRLLEPWLGRADVLKELPVPRLVALEVDRSNPPDFEAIRKTLAAQYKGATLDDHRHWQAQIRAVTRSFALGGLAILMLVGAATTAIIVSATKSALSANREIVEVLHFVGATDRFIAREFAGHFLRLGIKAGILGAGAAMLVFLALPFVMDVIGGGTVTMAEVRRLIGAGALDLAGYAILLVVVFVVAALCMLTSRIGVSRILNGPL